ncbi:MAG: hypothetical protein AAB573_03165 [Patescibacteria group bacterium]
MEEHREGAFSWAIRVQNGVATEGTRVEALPAFGKAFLPGIVQKVRDGMRGAGRDGGVLSPIVMVRFDDARREQLEFSGDWLTSRVKKI